MCGILNGSQVGIILYSLVMLNKTEGKEENWKEKEKQVLSEMYAIKQPVRTFSTMTVHDHLGQCPVQCWTIWSKLIS